ncbi:MAG: phosphoserine transaminase [Egibacteraceae bacterium]
MPSITIPVSLLPADGRFGSGPSKVRQEGMRRLGVAAGSLLGTSHRQAGVTAQVRRVREGMREFFSLPDGYEVVLGNGGAALFWDAAAHCLVSRRSAHAVFGEFSAKFAQAVQAAPFLDDPVIAESSPGSHPVVRAEAGVDLYALTHCETSTGVVMPIRRPSADGIVAVDATSAAGGVEFDVTEADAYFFSPQKCFGSEGGLFVALMSPAAIERVEAVRATGRYIPSMLDLGLALRSSAADQTYNTPSISTLFLMGEQLDWLNEKGGFAAAVKDCAVKSTILYDWAQARPWAAPFVADPSMRSPVVCTIDLDPSIPAGDVTATLRGNGIVDTEAYRKLGRNQLRIATFPAIAPADVERLTTSIDYVVAALGAP